MYFRLTRTLILIPGIWAALAAGPLTAQQVPAPSPRMLLERQALAVLAPLDGEWSGSGWTLVDGRHEPRLVTLSVSAQLGGATRVIENRTYGPDGVLLFHAFNNVAFNVDSGTHVIQARAEGRFGEFSFTPTADGYVWQLGGGGQGLRYTGTLFGDRWTEVTEILVPGQPAREIARFTVTRNQ